jgi:hypothetical protein
MVHRKTVKSIKDRIQSILVSKKDYPKLSDALKHLEKLGHDLTLLHTKVDETPNYYRFR